MAVPRFAYPSDVHAKSYPLRNTRGGGGGWWNLPLEFLTILPSVQSLWLSRQNEVNFMCGGAAESVWRQQTWSAILAAILGFAKI